MQDAHLPTLAWERGEVAEGDPTDINLSVHNTPGVQARCLISRCLKLRRPFSLAAVTSDASLTKLLGML